MSQLELNSDDVEFFNKKIADAFGLSEEFLTGDPAPSTLRDTLIHMRAELTDPVKVAERNARNKEFFDYLADRQYRIFLNWAPRTVTRRGVSVSVMVPKVEIKHFRSLRTAKVWNKRRIKENAKRV